MLTQELDRETERYLTDILAQQNMSSDELIRQLIRDRWLSLQQNDAPQAHVYRSTLPKQAAVPERMAASESIPAPDPTDAQTSLPRPRNQKQLIADFVRRKNQRSF